MRLRNRCDRGYLSVALLTLIVGPVVAGPSHRPSPDWRDQVIYFLMLDRFDDGDPANNDQGAGEYDPDDARKYSGGDLAGVTRRIDYLRQLGATAVWITPPVANQWWDGELGYGGYHGYWAEHFMRVDAHYGHLDDYRALARALHGADMALIQDVVVNHTGNFFSYRDGWDPADPARHYRRNRDARPHPAPSQWPFSLNDPRDPAQRQAAIYHFTPPIADFADRRQELEFALADLDDLNTENAVVRRFLRESYGFWIREVGVDGLRVDTAYHVPPEFFADFMHADDPQAPGMHGAARASGREDFLAFGEGFGTDRAFSEERARKLETYVRDTDGRPLLSSMIDFPLYGSLGDVFARGRPPAELGFRIESRMRVHADPHRMPTFVDNHDVDRFLAGATEAALKQALLAIFTLPGIPTLYYGTEQGFRTPRQAMFAGGYGAGGRDYFDTAAPLYRYLQRTIALRRGDRLYSRGIPSVLHANPAAPGALAWRIEHDGRSALVLINSADAETLLDNLDTGLAEGTRLEPVFAIDAVPAALMVGDGGRISLRLPARAGWVLVPGLPVDSPMAMPGLIAITTHGAGEVSPSPSGVSGAFESRSGEPANALAPAGAGAGARVGVRGRSEPDASSTPAPPPQPLSRRERGARRSLHDGADRQTVSFEVAGRAEGVPEFLLVLDGDLAGAQRVRPRDDGHFEATVDTAGLTDPAIEHRLVAWSEHPAAVSAPLAFRVDPQWTLLAETVDPAGDDTGPSRRYRYPTDPGWLARQGDLRAVRVFGAGGSLRIELDMAAVSAGWNPPNGFDRVAFTLFIELPGRKAGARVMPLQNARLPEGMRWHYRLRAGGWSNALFAHEGAGSRHEGRPVTPGAHIEVDAAANRIAFTLPATALGRPDTLTGARVYVTTWDYDGRYRDLAPEAGSHAFGGGDGARDPKVLDDLVVRLP